MDYTNLVAEFVADYTQGSHYLYYKTIRGFGLPLQS